jgi:hypothetical protein
MSDEKRVFKVQISTGKKDGKEVFEEKEFAVVKPTVAVLNEAAKLRQRVFNQAFEEGGLLRQQVEKELKSRNLWNDKLQQEYDLLQAEVISMLLQLERGGIKLSDARQLALEIADKRQQMVNMLVDRSELDNITCEGQADNERFNFLFANCLVYNDTGTKVFNSLEEYIANPSHPAAVQGASEFYYLLSGTENLDNDLPENKFLKKYNFVDSELRFTERGTGRLTDKAGNYIDEDGNYIKYNEDGTTYFVDFLGNKVDIVEGESAKKDEPLPFLDDDGNPVDDDGNPIVAQEQEEEKPKRTRKRRTKKTETVDADA